MVRLCWTGVVALLSWFAIGYSGTAMGLQAAKVSKPPRRDSALVALLREGYSLPESDGGHLTIDEVGSAALCWYNTFTDIQTVRALLDKGADVNARDWRRATALLYAAGHASHPVIEELLRRGADVNAADRFGETPLMIVAQNRDVHLVSLFLKHGAKVNARDKTGYSAIACVYGNPQLVSILLRAGAKVDAWTLTTATYGRDASPASIDALLNTGISVNARDANGQTALFGAAATNKVELVRYLLGRGADVRVRDNLGRTVLEYASDGGINELKPQVVELLRKAGATK